MCRFFIRIKGRKNASDIWNEVLQYEGEVFHTKQNLELIYKVEGEMVSQNRTAVRLGRKDFDKAVELHPKKPNDLQNKVTTGPSYVFAIITARMRSSYEYI